MARVRVATFNIRTAWAPDGRHSWPFRVNALVSTVDGLDADVLGLQEVTGPQRWVLQRRLPNLGIHGSGRSRCRRGEASPLLVRDGFAEVLATRTRWFGPTPDQPGSRISGTQFPRIATTCSLRTSRGLRFDMTSLHLDHRSEPARSTSVHQLLDWLDDSVPQIIVGDFNATLRSGSVRFLLENGFSSALDASSGGTFHGFAGRALSGAIDHVLFSNHFRVLNAAVIETKPGTTHASDHWPVLAELEIS
ncbi:MAG: endonuclease/exonuclease/phosphatase family protein [Microthrixaceae bacterium]